MLKTRTAHPPQPESVFSIQKGTEFPFDELGDWVITFLLPEEERFKFFRDDAVERALLRMARLETDYHQARSATPKGLRIALSRSSG